MAKSKRVKLNVVKVSGDYNFDFRVPNWADMPLLYLELLENKDKVKPELRHTDYEPTGIDISSLPNFSQVKTNFAEDTKREIENVDNPSYQPQPISTIPITVEPSPIISLPPVIHEEEKPLIQLIPDSSSHMIDLHTSSISLPEPSVPEPSIQEEDPILNILRGESDTSVSIQNAQVMPIATSSIPVKQPIDNPFPTLSQINSGISKPGHKDLTSIPRNEEKESQTKRELLFKFKTLRKHYPDVQIPEFSEYSDYQTMQKEYEMLVRQIRVDSNVENYKKYLIIGFGLVEFVLSKFLKFGEIEGFTQQQIFGMNQYEKLLVELGEKHQVEPSKQWGPELRLIGMIAMNAVIFVGTKMLFKAGSGADILGMISNQAPASKPATTSKQPSSQSSSTMRGPDTSDIDNL